MYENYFGFGDLPFRITPERHYFYSNATYRRAFANLSEGIERRRGLIVVTGEIGTGKTLLMTTFIHQNQNDRFKTAWILNPSLTFAGLLRCALQDLDVAPQSNDPARLIRQLENLCRQEAGAGRNVALFIDETQTLAGEVFKQLPLLLFDSRMDDDASLQIVLLGQPELEHKIDNPFLGALKERVKVHIRLAPLATDEIGPYIEWRLGKAGYQGKPLFDAQAIGRIAVYSAGIPRLINIICDNALLIGFALSQKTISAQIIDEVADDLLVSGRPRLEANMADAPRPLPQQASPLAASGAPRAGVVRSNALAESRADIAVVAFSVAILLVLGWFLRDGFDVFSRNSAFLSRVAPESAASLEPFTDHEPAPARPQSSDGANDSAWRDYRERKSEARPMLLKNTQREIAMPPAAQSPTPGSQLNTASRPSRNFADESVPIRRAETRSAASTAGHPGNTGPPRSIALVPGQNDTLPRPRALPPRYWPNEQKSRGGSQKTASDRDFFRGTFEVTADSLLFDGPAHQSALLKTLRPGVRVQVENKIGNFLAVRSLEDPAMEGYVHLEDAFFRRISPQNAARE